MDERATTTLQTRLDPQSKRAVEEAARLRQVGLSEAPEVRRSADMGISGPATSAHMKGDISITPIRPASDSEIEVNKSGELEPVMTKRPFRERSASMATLSAGNRLGKLCVRGLTRVQFAVVCKVIACNINRWAEGLAL